MRLIVEELEPRNLLSTLTVLSPADTGPDSFRQALLDAQAGDMIQFAPDVSTITPLSPLPTITQAITVDGGGTVTIDGSQLGAGAVGIRLDGIGATIDGLSFTGFDGSRNGDLSSDADIVITGDGNGNVVSNCTLISNGEGINVGGTGNTVQGCTISGTSSDGVLVVGDSNTISGNTISSIGQNGVNVHGSQNLISANLVSDCRISGVDLADGSNNTASGNTLTDNSNGMDIQGVANLVTGNVIGSNAHDGVVVSSSTALDNVIQGNLIGVDADNNSMPNGWYGVEVNSGGKGGSQGTIIGGAGNGQGNTIANNGLGGVYVFDPSSSGNNIDPNSIYDNGGLGIGLANGANEGAKPPAIASVSSSGGNLTVDGSLHGTPGASYSLEFFANQRDAFEGKTFLGRAVVTVDSSGEAVFHLRFSAHSGSFITATSTDARGNTSEFSAPVSVLSPVESVSVANVRAFDGFFANVPTEPQTVGSQEQVVFALASTPQAEGGSSGVSVIEESEAARDSGGRDKDADADGDKDAGVEDFPDIETIERQAA